MVRATHVPPLQGAARQSTSTCSSTEGLLSRNPMADGFLRMYDFYQNGPKGAQGSPRRSGVGFGEKKSRSLGGAPVRLLNRVGGKAQSGAKWGIKGVRLLRATAALSQDHGALS